MVSFNPFKSISEIKEKGEFIPKGKILPARILKASKRKYQHIVKTGSNQWVFPTKKGYLIFVENNDEEFSCVLRITRSCVNVAFQGSPYQENQQTKWQGNSGLDEEQFLMKFNELYLRMNGQPVKCED